MLKLSRFELANVDICRLGHDYLALDLTQIRLAGSLFVYFNLDFLLLLLTSSLISLFGRSCSFLFCLFFFCDCCILLIQCLLILSDKVLFDCILHLGAFISQCLELCSEFLKVNVGITILSVYEDALRICAARLLIVLLLTLR